MEKQTIDSMLNDPAKLKWACRRGMLELDVLLGNFVERGYSSLNDEEKSDFIQLLSMQDPELFALLMRQVEPTDERLAQLIVRIRQYARG